MYDFIVLRTTHLLDFVDIETTLRNKYAKGVCINTFKIEQMINPISISGSQYTSNVKSLYLPLLDFFFNAKYSPIILIGGFMHVEINNVISLYSDNMFSISLYSSDEKTLLKMKNKNNYTLLNTKDELTKYKSKRTGKYSYSDALALNKQISETSNLTNISIDILTSDTMTILNKIISSL